MSGMLTDAGLGRALQAGVGQAVAASAAMYVALATALPAGSATATLAAFGSVEITTAGYARQAATWDAPTGSGPVVINSAAEIEFGPFSADPPEVTHAFLCTTSIGVTGSALAFWEFETPKDAAVNDSIIVGAGDLDISVT